MELIAAAIQSKWAVQLPGESAMQDLLFVMLTVAFFAVSIGYVYFCEKVR